LSGTIDAAFFPFNAAAMRPATASDARRMKLADLLSRELVGFGGAEREQAQAIFTIRS
jgi:hypothetical protein